MKNTIPTAHVETLKSAIREYLEKSRDGGAYDSAFLAYSPARGFDYYNCDILPLDDDQEIVIERLCDRDTFLGISDDLDIETIVAGMDMTMAEMILADT